MALLDSVNIVSVSVLKKSMPMVSLYLAAGSIMFSTPLLPGTITLLDLKVRVLLKTPVEGSSLKLPAGLASGLVLWQTEHPKVSSAGKLVVK